jgi:hypothetical protein
MISGLTFDTLYRERRIVGSVLYCVYMYLFLALSICFV